MNIIIQKGAQSDEVEIVIRCKQATDEILNMLAVLRTFDNKLIDSLDGKTFLVKAADILYFDTVDKRTFLYTSDKVLETSLRLYELEARLCGGSFFRASKSYFQAVIGACGIYIPPHMHQFLRIVHA